jgi:hypothetical protein
MKPIIPILALGFVFTASGAMAKSMGLGSNMTLSPPIVAPTPPPTLNPGAIGIQSQTLGNPGLIGPASSGQIDTPDLSGALPGEPGSPTYDPSAGLPALGNAGSALAPNPGTSAAGFNTPSVSSGTNPASGTGG